MRFGSDKQRTYDPIHVHPPLLAVGAANPAADYRSTGGIASATPASPAFRAHGRGNCLPDSKLLASSCGRLYPLNTPTVRCDVLLNFRLELRCTY